MTDQKNPPPGYVLVSKQPIRSIDSLLSTDMQGTTGSPESQQQTPLSIFASKAELLRGIRDKWSKPFSPSPSSPSRFTDDEEKFLFQLLSGKGPDAGVASGVKVSHSLNTISAITALTATPTYWTGLTVGTEYNQRIGRSVRAIRTVVRLEGQFVQSSQAFASYYAPNVRFMIVRDTMPSVAVQWAENKSPVVGVNAIVTTNAAGDTFNVVAPHHPTTVPTRFHIYHDHIACLKNGSLPIFPAQAAGTGAAGTNYVQHSPFHMEWDINMHGAEITWFSTNAGDYLKNACFMFIAMDSNTLNAQAACLSTVSFSFFFQDVQE